jgi:hypothetical protein
MNNSSKPKVARDRSKHRGTLTWDALTVTQNDEKVKSFDVKNVSFGLTIFVDDDPSSGSYKKWISNGVIMPDGKVSGETAGDGRDDWHEMLDTLNVRSIGQALGRELRDLAEPKVYAERGPNLSTLRLQFAAAVDSQIKRGRLPESERESEIDFLVNEEIERRNAVNAEKRAQALQEIEKDGAVTGVQSGNGGAAR